MTTGLLAASRIPNAPKGRPSAIYSSASRGFLNFSPATAVSSLFTAKVKGFFLELAQAGLCSQNGSVLFNWARGCARRGT
ncbi:hypothetical protein CBOM_03097 [Ceraceosorus bombacis]|uniref:Uncharacterized protein n=1 Tax=Ceraceosorus bombacis TaxID=401625 RepID=A0A0P1BMA5_9BASI|nr:hypothetical protein CBOM_03097 [Ceraceosorus bombacis]